MAPKPATELVLGDFGGSWLEHTLATFASGQNIRRTTPNQPQSPSSPSAASSKEKPSITGQTSKENHQKTLSEASAVARNVERFEDLSRQNSAASTTSRHRKSQSVSSIFEQRPEDEGHSRRWTRDKYMSITIDPGRPRSMILTPTDFYAFDDNASSTHPKSDERNSDSSILKTPKHFYCPEQTPSPDLQLPLLTPHPSQPPQENRRTLLWYFPKTPKPPTHQQQQPQPLLKTALLAAAHHSPSLSKPLPELPPPSPPSKPSPLSLTSPPPHPPPTLPPSNLLPLSRPPNPPPLSPPPHHPTLLRLPSGTVLSLTTPETHPWKRSRYTHGPVRVQLHPPHLAGRKDSVATMAMWGDVAEGERRGLRDEVKDLEEVEGVVEWFEGVLGRVVAPMEEGEDGEEEKEGGLLDGALIEGIARMWLRAQRGSENGLAH